MVGVGVELDLRVGPESSGLIHCRSPTNEEAWGLRIYRPGFRVWGLKLGVVGGGCRVEGIGFDVLPSQQVTSRRAMRLGYRVQFIEGLIHQGHRVQYIALPRHGGAVQ